MIEMIAKIMRKLTDKRRTGKAVIILELFKVEMS